MKLEEEACWNHLELGPSDLGRSCRQDWRFCFLRFLAESFVDLASRVLILHLFVAYGEGLRIFMERKQNGKAGT